VNQQTPITPVPVSTVGEERPTSVIVFGGTFDPPHVGHVRLPVRVREVLDEREGEASRSWLLYVPAARSPHKEYGPVASDDERSEMLRLALSETPRSAVWTDEMDRGRVAISGTVEADAGAAGGTEHKPAPSYTVDTLARLREWLDEHGLSGAKVFLLIGADQAVTFHYWRQPRDILRLAKPLVMIRGEARNADALVERIGGLGFWDRREMEMWRGAIVPIGRIDVSATQVRAALAAGSEEEAANLLPPSVLEYIRERKLYRRAAAD
jgi:nicotinate-nucleotide adenylyltransferase